MSRTHTSIHTEKVDQVEHVDITFSDPRTQLIRIDGGSGSASIFIEHLEFAEALEVAARSAARTIRKREATER